MATLTSSLLPGTVSANLSPKVNAITLSKKVTLSTSAHASQDVSESLGRRQVTLASISAAIAILDTPLSARADDFYEYYKKETQAVIDNVKYTLGLARDDPNKEAAVSSLRALTNDWVAKYRREKSVAGKPSFSNLYSVVNAISGHFISFGPTYPIPKKRAVRIFEEITDAERALSRGR